MRITPFIFGGIGFLILNWFGFPGAGLFFFLGIGVSFNFRRRIR